MTPSDARAIPERIVHLHVKPLAQQPAALSFILFFTVMAVTLLLANLFFTFGIHPVVLLRDPNATAKQPEYYGFVSNLGILGWAATAAISLHTGLHLHRLGETTISRILLTGGIFTTVLCLDDLFMLHEGLLARLGISEVALLLTYAVLAVVWVAASVRQLLNTEWLLLFIALMSMAGSVVIDVSNIQLPGQILAEDMFKLHGIVFWAAYFIRLSGQSLR